MLHMFGYMVGAWFYCMEVCYNSMYYFMHIVHVFVLGKILLTCHYESL